MRTQLSTRLSDTSNVFWTDTEVGVYLAETLRLYGVLSGFWREQGSFNTSASTAFYDIATQLSTQLGYTVTDRDIIKSIQYHLLESVSTQSSWGGTEQFVYNDIVNAVQNRLNQFMSDTGIVVNESNQAIAAAGQVTIAETIVDVRRLGWKTGANVWSSILRTDERMLTAYDQTWPQTASRDVPTLYSVMAPPPLTVQLYPAPANGTLYLYTVDSKALNPASSATVLGIPDDLTPAIKWGALADLLGKDGLAMDPIRAAYCESRYQQYVQIAQMMPAIVNSKIGASTAAIAGTVYELDNYLPGWQNTTGTPTNIYIGSYNLIGIYPVPTGATSIVLDVVRKAPVPSADGTNLQIGREELDAIIDYAEHLALFKVGGTEWHATDAKMQNFMLQSIVYNQRVSASARAAFSASVQSVRENWTVPRRGSSPVGLGALKEIGNG